jgi:hypothetical protein
VRPGGTADSIGGNALAAVVAIMTFLAAVTSGGVAMVISAALEWQSDIAQEMTASFGCAWPLQRLPTGSGRQQSGRKVSGRSDSEGRATTRSTRLRVAPGHVRELAMKGPRRSGAKSSLLRPLWRTAMITDPTPVETLLLHIGPVGRWYRLLQAQGQQPRHGVNQ